MLSRKVRAGTPGLQCWAVRVKRAESMFRDTYLADSLNRSRQFIREAEGALVVTDRNVTVMFADDSQVSASLVDMMCALSEVFSAARTTGGGSPDTSRIS